MSLGQIYRVAGHGGFPRVSGDEPYTLHATYSASRFSPRERG